MHSIIPPITRFAVIAFLAVTLMIPAHAMAQPRSETITAQVAITVPPGRQLSGAIVVQRTVDRVIRSRWSFSGLLDGLPLQASGEAIERWLINGRIEVEITQIFSITLNGNPLARNPDGSPAVPLGLLQTMVAEDRGNGVIVVQGVPLAINGPLQQPGSGNQSYIITNAGRGTGQVDSLPNTAAQQVSAPAMPATALVVAFLGVLLLATLSRRRIYAAIREDRPIEPQVIPDA